MGVVDVVDATYTTAWIYITYTTTDIKVKWNETKICMQHLCCYIADRDAKDISVHSENRFFLFFDPQGLETCYVQLPVSLILAFR